MQQPEKPDPPEDPGPPESPTPPPTVGPLDADTIAAARTLSLLQLGAMLVLVVATVSIAVAQTPRVLAGLGLIDRTEATVISVGSAGPAESGGTARASDDVPSTDDECARSLVTVRWPGGGEPRAVTWCPRGDEATPEPGDVVRLWTAGSFAPIPAGARSPNTVLAVLLLVVLLASAGGAVRYVRQVRALIAAGRRRLTRPQLPGQVDRLLVQRGIIKKNGRVRLRVAFDDDGLRPLYVVVPHAVDRSMLGARVVVRPLGRGRRGRWTGPYVLRQTGGDRKTAGAMVGLGRAYRAIRGRERG